jgi:hypothetical protein
VQHHFCADVLCSIYKVQAGSETAVTYVARPMTNWGDDPTRQSYVLQMSFYSKTIIKNIRNVQSLPNVFLCGLERG